MKPTVAKLLVDTLVENNFDQLYCLPGVQNDDFFNVLYDYQAQINPLHSRHEQGAAYMALGAALATGKTQAFSIVPGPGLLNGSAALSTAYATNAPLLALIGQIPSGAIDKDFGLLHEIPQQTQLLQNLSKKTESIRSGERAQAQIHSAMSALHSGRPRPVALEVPVNVWNQEVADFDPQAQWCIEQPPEIDSDLITSAVALINSAERPLIIIGGGAQSSSEQVTQLAELISAPCSAFRNGHGVVSSDNPLSICSPIGHKLWPKADLIIALGTRLQTQQMQWGVDAELKVIHIDIDAKMLGHINRPELAINADLQTALPLLLNRLQAQGDRTSWLDIVRTEKAKMTQQFATELAPQLQWLTVIREELPAEGIFVDELTQVGYVSRFAFPTYQPRTFLSTGYQGTLGWGIATAMGAAHARRDVPVVSISGDGGALFTISELASAAKHNIPLTVIIFNDNAFGNVRRFQIENYDNRPICSDLSSPDFVKLADSFGIESSRAHNPQELRLQLRHALQNQAPNVIEVPVGDFPSPWQHILLPKVRGQ